MKLLTYKTQDTEPRLGFIHNNQVIDMQDFGDVSNFPLPNDMLELIDMGFEIIPEITEMIAETPENFFEEIAYEMNEVTILAPIEKPRKNIIGIGLNYTEHVAESARTLDTTGKLPTKPIIFSKPPTTVTATNTQIIKNTKLTSQLDWECELAVIISKKGKYVPKSDMTAMFMEQLEQMIRKAPQYWLWTHKRWKRTKEEWLRRQQDSTIK
jgi:2-keto-4-pentenoate hydratase/2-oxohepta-3-ene-1,7-dioic acid hydratase in catechol pathway